MNDEDEFFDKVGTFDSEKMCWGCHYVFDPDDNVVPHPERPWQWFCEDCYQKRLASGNWPVRSKK